MPVSRLAPGAFAGVLVFGLAWFDGGFYAPAWGVVSLGLLGVCGCAIVLSERLYLSRLALVSIGGLFGLAAWTLMSGFWTSDLTKTISDAELAFVYPIALTASLLVARRTGTSALAIGTLVAMVAVCLYALGGRLAPDVFGFPNSVDADRAAVLADRLLERAGSIRGDGGAARRRPRGRATADRRTGRRVRIVGGHAGDAVPHVQPGRADRRRRWAGGARGGLAGPAAARRDAGGQPALGRRRSAGGGAATAADGDDA